MRDLTNIKAFNSAGRINHIHVIRFKRVCLNPTVGKEKKHNFFEKQHNHES